MTPLHLPPRENWIKILAAALLWTAASAYVIFAFLEDFFLAVTQAATLSTFIIIGCWLLGNIFSFYTPKKAQFWIVLTLPVILTIGFASLDFYLYRSMAAPASAFTTFIENSILVKGGYLFLMFFFWSILLVVTGKLEDQKALQEKEEKSIQLSKEAELYYLRQQLQPHFLFNSLNSINALITSKPEKAREMLIQLAEFLRSTIRLDGSKWTTIAQEIEQLQRFLEIEKVRFGERLQVEFTISEESETQLVPQLLIQPLLENAIKHGLYGVTGQVNIRISFAKQDNYATVSLSNPFDPKAGQAKGSGFGLEAVKRRLYLLFGRTDLIQTHTENDHFIVHLRVPQLQ